MEHTADVDGLLERLSPEVMDGWEAFDALEPIGTGRLFDILADIGCAVAASKGVEVSRETFLTWLKAVEREPTGKEQLATLRRSLSSAYGAVR